MLPGSWLFRDNGKQIHLVCTLASELLAAINNILVNKKHVRITFDYLIN